jgi:hypothetical protein
MLTLVLILLDTATTALSRLQVQVLSDCSGAFTRLLGLEQPSGPQGPPCQRFAAVVDNGILLRLVRDSGLDCSCGSAVQRFWWCWLIMCESGSSTELLVLFK